MHKLGETQLNGFNLRKKYYLRIVEGPWTAGAWCVAFVMSNLLQYLW